MQLIGIKPKLTTLYGNSKNTSNCFNCRLLAEKNQIENQTSHITRTLERKIKELEEELETARRQVAATVCGAEVKKEKIETKITDLEQKIRKEKEEEKVNSSKAMCIWY